MLPDLWLPDPGDRGSRPEKLELLYALVKASKPEVCIETGTYRGASALAIGAALRSLGSGYLCTTDPVDHGAREWVARNGLERWVTCLSCKGEKLLDLGTGAFDFVYIDCAWETRLHSLELAIDRLPPGGIIVVDDVRHPGWNNTAPGERDRAEELCQVVLPVFHGLGIYALPRIAPEPAESLPSDE